MNELAQNTHSLTAFIGISSTEGFSVKGDKVVGSGAGQLRFGLTRLDTSKLKGFQTLLEKLR